MALWHLQPLVRANGATGEGGPAVMLLHSAVIAGAI